MSAHVTFVKNSVLAIALLENSSRGYVAARNVPNQQERRAVVPGREWMMEMAEGVCCCPTKRVGGSEYRLMRLAGSPLPLECLSPCIYEGDSGGEFCFAAGTLPVQCL